MEEKDKLWEDPGVSEGMNFGESLEDPADSELQEAAGERFGVEESNLATDPRPAPDDTEEMDFGERIGSVETPDDFEAYEEEIRRRSDL